MLVAPSEEIAAREKLELEALRQLDELAPLRTDWFQINYADANDLYTLFEDKEKTLLSARGKVVVDERTNTLMIQDVATNLDEIRKIITHLDIAVRQVLIASRNVIATEDLAKELGVKLGLNQQNTTKTGHYDGQTDVGVTLE